MEKIKPCLWYDNQAAEAAEFYCSLFGNSTVKSSNKLVTEFSIGGQEFLALNGGPVFRFTPAISMFVTCEDDSEIDALWERLLAGDSKILMQLDKYDWSEKYGWIADKYGLTWQIYKGKFSDVNSKITPCMLFTDARFGQAESAVNFYASVFPGSEIEGIAFYPEGDPSTGGKVMHAQFRLSGKVFMAMDGPGEHNFGFNEAYSLVITCRDQQEIDYYWNKLTEGGEESMCGWLKDRFGVSWQVVPEVLAELMNDPERAGRVTEAFLKMKKFDIGKLLEA